MSRNQKTQARRSSATRKRESGEPGGGQGRRDEVRGSRVYPISGPWPRGNPPIRTEAAWGQGERGAAGYEDSGRSGLDVGTAGTRRPQRGVRGTRTAGQRQPSQRPVEAENIEEIPQTHWVKFLNNFSRQHEGWLAELEVRERGARKRTEARRLPFEGITVDLKEGAKNTTSVILEMQSNVHLTHLVPRTKRIHFKEQPETEITITAANGEKTTVHFYRPVRSRRLLPPPRPRRR